MKYMRKEVINEMSDFLIDLMETKVQSEDTELLSEVARMCGVDINTAQSLMCGMTPPTERQEAALFVAIRQYEYDVVSSLLSECIVGLVATRTRLYASLEKEFHVDS